MNSNYLGTVNKKHIIVIVGTLFSKNNLSSLNGSVKSVPYYLIVHK